MNIFVGQEYCFVNIDPKEYSETFRVDDVYPGVDLVVVMASSTCGGYSTDADILFEITQQMLQPSMYSMIEEFSVSRIYE